MDTRVHDISSAMASSQSRTTPPREAADIAAPIVRGVDIPGTAASVAHGRRFVDSVLDELGLTPQRDEIVLMASELLTNSVLHGRGSVEVVVTWLAPFLEVAVTDQGSGMGPRATPSTFATSGRGLQLVEQLATRCGTRASATETTVWFALHIDPCRPAG